MDGVDEVIRRAVADARRTARRREARALALTAVAGVLLGLAATLVPWGGTALAVLWAVAAAVLVAVAVRYLRAVAREDPWDEP